MYKKFHMEIKVSIFTCALIVIFFIIFLLLKKIEPKPILTFTYGNKWFFFIYTFQAFRRKNVRLGDVFELILV